MLVQRQILVVLPPTLLMMDNNKKKIKVLSAIYVWIPHGMLLLACVDICFGEYIIGSKIKCSSLTKIKSPNPENA